MLDPVPPPDGVAHWPLGAGISNVEIHAACDVPKIASWAFLILLIFACAIIGDQLDRAIGAFHAKGT